MSAMPSETSARAHRRPIVPLPFRALVSIFTRYVDRSHDMTVLTSLQFVLTDKDTVLATVYIKEQYDLSSWNVTTEDGTSGWILGGAFEEIDVATGKFFSVESVTRC